ADGAAFVTDEKVITGSSDTANKRCARTVRHRPGRIIGRVRFAIRTGMTIRSPADFAARLEIDVLPRCHINPRIGPGCTGYHHNLLLAQTTRPASLKRLSRFVSFESTKLDSYDLIPIDPPEAPAEAGFLEFDDAILKRDQLTWDTTSVAKYERVRVDRRDETQQHDENE